MELIDFGLEEMEVHEDRVFIYGGFTDFGALSKACEDMEIEGIKAALKRIPTSPLDVTEEQMADIEVIIDKLEDDDDVQAVYTNIA